jgi:hypothetical protein
MRRSIVVLAAWALLSGGMGRARAGVIVSPVSGTTTMGEAFPLSHAFDQSGLSPHFTSGVTDFTSYIAGDPRHDSEPGNDWVSNTTTGVAVFDLGRVMNLDSVAIWNFGGLGGTLTFAITRVTLEASLDASFSNPTNLGTFNLSVFATTNPAQVFSFPSVDAEFVRLRDFQSNGAPAIGLGEIAFDAAPAPEPSTLTLFGIGTLGLIGCAWRRRAGRA